MTMADRDGMIWLDGEMVPWREAKVHVLTHTLHYSMGCFEGIRAYKTHKGTAVFRLREHIERLFRSAHILRIPMPYDRAAMVQVCRDVIRENGLESAYLRPLCFYGPEGMGLRADNLRTHVAVAAWYWGAYLGDAGQAKGIRVKTSSYTRHHINVTMCKAKANGNYMNSMLALQEALQDGYDEALLLDPEGYVSEGSGENLFMVRDGTLYTPDLSSALEGITRDTIIAFAEEIRLPLREKRITRDEVYIAEEAFFTGTAAEVTPIRELDNRLIGSGGLGPITARLQKMYFDQVHGRRDGHSEWLSYVDRSG